MHSAIYKGLLRHRRFIPLDHKFSYKVFMVYLDLDEIDKVLSMTRFWSRKAWRPARYERSDFLGDSQISLQSAVRERIYEETGRRQKGPIRMLANLRYFGFNINPITCYYCFDEQENLETIVAEVTNTPWKERKSYVLTCDPKRQFQRINFQKSLHVSPFNPMDMTYRWTSNNPSERLSLNLEAMLSGDTYLDATLILKRHPIHARSLKIILLQYPWFTARILAAIYWQALRLGAKNTPFHTHPKLVNQVRSNNR
jgi:DUF1365 family protein